MLPNRVPWTLKDVVLVYLLRLVLGLILVRLVYPIMFTPSTFLIEITDRLLVLALIWTVLRRYGVDFGQWGLSWRGAGRNIGVGVAAGMVLLGVSLYSERIYTTMLFATPVQHPLIAQVEQATTWRQLVAPLFLSGVAAPVTEEVLYRLFTFLPLKARWGLWGGALASAAIFALLHFNAYWLAEMIVVGVGLALVYYWTGSLLSAIVAHSFINTSKVLMIFAGLPLI